MAKPEENSCRIDKDGHLFIKKQNILLKQCCPFRGSRDTNGCCGLWCPLFVIQNNKVQLKCGLGAEYTIEE